MKVDPLPYRQRMNQLWIRIPYWLIAIIILGIYILFLITTQDPFNRIFIQLQEGVQVTLRVSFASYFNAIVIGLFVGLIRAYPVREIKRMGDITRLILFQVSFFHISKQCHNFLLILNTHYTN